MSIAKKIIGRTRRHRRIRSRLLGTAQCPRLVVCRSSKHIYAQLVDDESSKTLVSSSTLQLKNRGNIKTAAKVGTQIAKQALDLGIKKVVFDRGGYKYHGQVKAVAESARQEGLKF